ncbi:MAG TPA: hypothetical protein VGG06_35180 [Thermoanaerobaculia bacterium]|jgi:formylglycine-generating enzyme required for sulfatase activity
MKSLSLLAAVLAGSASVAAMAETLAEQNAALFAQLEEVHGLTAQQRADLEAIFARGRFIGQGNSAVTRHPVTAEECRERLASSGVTYENPRFTAICGERYMAPLYDPAFQTPEDATACIDQFEFPDVPCAFPVVWVRASEAAQICAALGKRLCDAHEWEGACAGALTEPDYRFDLAAGAAAGAAVSRMRAAHNGRHAANKTWSYGPQYEAGVCAAAGAKTDGCDGGGWRACGSNTYPAGSFPGCKSALGVYDLHGNAAEHMNLPLAPEQMASGGSTAFGVTEMKGSWFIFDRYRAHEDWCRWRAPFWHGSRVMDPASHHNYHLGFRCCKNIASVGD